MPTFMDLLQGQIATYAKAGMDGDQSRTKRENLESYIDFGLMLYREVLKINKRWTKISRATKREDLDVEATRREMAEFRRLYSEWLRPSRPTLDAMRTFEVAGEDVAGAGAYRESVLRAKAFLVFDLDAVLRAEDQVLRGERHTLQEVRDGLRSRAVARRA